MVFALGGGQVVYALAWGQLSLASDFPRMQVMRALHHALRRLLAASPWAPENTIRAMYAVAHRALCARPTAIAAVEAWLEYMEGDTLHRHQHPQRV